MHRTAYYNEIGPPNPGTVLLAERPSVSVDWRRSPRDNARVERRSSGRRTPQRSTESWRRPQRADLFALGGAATAIMTAILISWYLL